MKDLRYDRLLELLTDQALFGSTENELMELEQLQKQFPDWENDFSLELTAAAIGLSDLTVNDDLPANLREKVFADADQFFNRFEKHQNSSSSFAEAEPEKQSIFIARESVGSSLKTSFGQWLGWTFAAAACIALIANIWLTRFQKQPEIVKVPETVQTSTPELSAAQKRAQLLATASDAVQITLANPKNEKEILGDMVWSNSLQKGYAHLTALPINDAAKETYQMWIVDEAQNEKTPISGGVFDVGRAGDIIVPINAQIKVLKPKAIAVTKEKAGGVVVSEPSRIIAVAKIQA